MARRMNLKSRPGLLFVIILIVCFILLYYSWRSMSSQKYNHPPVNSDSRHRAYKVFKDRNVNQRKKHNPSIEHQNREFNMVSMNSRKSELKHKKVADTKFGIQPITAADVKQYSLTGETSNKYKVKNSHSLPTTEMKENSTIPYYKKINSSISHILMSMERFVHLDLKGAAPKVSYLKDLFPLLNKMGATGLLIEYEDTFPYSGTLEGLASKNAYSKEDIDEIQSLAKVNGLKIMPLIQTFGHMEFVLKYADKQFLRESSHTPQVIRSDKNSTYSLITEMINQMLDAHEEATRLHIGCDEVYELGRGSSADVIASKKVTVEQLFLKHVRHVASLVGKYGTENNRKVTPVMWDDELRKISFEEIKDSSLHDIVEIMIWKYTPDVMDSITEMIWKKYSKLFPHVWIASSFKGATGARQFYTDPHYHISNHFSWLEVIEKYGDKIQFTGVALTGWQRFDHFATLCELIPAAVPSLAVCLATMKYGGFNEQIHKNTSQLLHCNNLIEMKMPDVNPRTFATHVSQDCRFPGSHFYYALQEFYGYRMRNKKLEQNMEGQLSDYQIVHGYSNPGYLTFLRKKLNELNANYSSLINPIKEELLNIYSMETVEEWLEEHIFERIRRNNDHLSNVKKLLSNTSWKGRPFVKIDVDKEFSSSKGKDNQVVSKMERPLLKLPIYDQTIPVKKNVSSSAFQIPGSKNRQNPIPSLKQLNSSSSQKPENGALVLQKSNVSSSDFRNKQSLKRSLSRQGYGAVGKTLHNLSPKEKVINLQQFEGQKKQLHTVYNERKMLEGKYKKEDANAVKSDNMPVSNDSVLFLPKLKNIKKRQKLKSSLSLPTFKSDNTKLNPKHLDQDFSMPLPKPVHDKNRQDVASDREGAGTRQENSYIQSYKKKALDLDSPEGIKMLKSRFDKHTIKRGGQLSYRASHLNEHRNKNRLSDQFLEKNDIHDEQMNAYEHKLLLEKNDMPDEQMNAYEHKLLRQSK